MGRQMDLGTMLAVTNCIFAASYFIFACHHFDKHLAFAVDPPKE